MKYRIYLRLGPYERSGGPLAIAIRSLLKGTSVFC